MARQQTRRRRLPADPTPFEQARDELFQHVIHCGVIGAAGEDQADWFNQTMAYFADRFPELSESEIVELRTLGERFSKPLKSQEEPQEDTASAA
jgi:hypothetical protein